MISDVSAAAGLIEFHAFLAQDMLAHEQVFSLSVAALGDDVGMLAEQKNIFDGLDFSGADDTPLQRVRFRVTNEPQRDLQSFLHRNFERQAYFPLGVLRSPFRDQRLE